jgi:hypothetical protein
VVLTVINAPVQTNERPKTKIPDEEHIDNMRRFVEPSRIQTANLKSQGNFNSGWYMRKNFLDNGGVFQNSELLLSYV